MVFLVLLACAPETLPKEHPPAAGDSPTNSPVDSIAWPPDSPTDSSDSPTDTSDSPSDSPAESRTCGDAIKGAAEECDGQDADDCRGACSTACQCPSTAPTGELSLHMIDVWQADGFLLVSPDGFTLLVDAGDEDTYGHLRGYLRAAGVDALDHTLVSHQHADHMGAMDLILEDHPEIGAAYDGGGVATTDAFEDYVAAAGARRTTVEAGDFIDLGPSLDVEVLHGDVGDRDNENNNSVVIRVTYGETTLLMGGDCENPICERAFDPGPVDIYKVHHHGASDSTGSTLLSAMAPATALISAGLGNDYGHPDPTTIRALEAAGTTIWRTDESGDVVVRSDGNTYTVGAE